MKEKIYTIPVTDAFNVECECPVCVLEKKLEDEYVEYMLGPSLMEPEGRIETNDKGFCRRHFEKLYNKQENRLGLGLTLDTHLVEQNHRIKKIYEGGLLSLQKDLGLSFMKNLTAKLSAKPSESTRTVDQLIEHLTELEKKCAICDKLDFTMDRYIDVILYLWVNESDFRNLFNSKKGFCLYHLRQLLEGAKKYLNTRDAAAFINNMMNIQLENMDRVQKEVNWFTKKFDYRNNDASWGNSKDAVPRSIQKIAGNCDFK